MVHVPMLLLSGRVELLQKAVGVNLIHFGLKPEQSVSSSHSLVAEQLSRLGLGPGDSG